MLEWVWFCGNQTHSPLTSFNLEFGCRVPKGRSQVRDPFSIELEFYREYLYCHWGLQDRSSTPVGRHILQGFLSDST